MAHLQQTLLPIILSYASRRGSTSRGSASPFLLPGKTSNVLILTNHVDKDEEKMEQRIEGLEEKIISNRVREHEV